MAFSHCAYECQAQPGAADVATRFHAYPRERFEQARQVRVSDALALVANGYSPEARFFFDAAFDARLRGLYLMALSIRLHRARINRVWSPRV